LLLPHNNPSGEKSFAHRFLGLLEEFSPSPLKEKIQSQIVDIEPSSLALASVIDHNASRGDHPLKDEVLDQKSL
jgi:hypothetical protein